MYDLINCVCKEVFILLFFFLFNYYYYYYYYSGRDGVGIKF